MSNRHVQKVLNQVAKRVSQLEIDHAERQAIIEHVFDESRVAMLRAWHSADFIYRLIEASPSIPVPEREKLRAVADELMDLAHQSPKNVLEAGRQELAQAQTKDSKPDALDGVIGELKGEWEALKTELGDLFRWNR